MRSAMIARASAALLGALIASNALGQERIGTRALPPMASNAKTGPAVGSRIPAFQGEDAQGKVRTFADLRGPRGLVLVFARSADWCPYCKTQLADINTKLNDFRKRGLNVASITYDSTATLQEFSKRVGIGFPMLSDPKSTAIQAFGILNDNVDKGTPQYGIPFPGIYIVNAKGVVTSKYFEQDYRERYSAASILSHEFGADGIARTSVETNHLTLTSSVSTAGAAPGHRLTLIVEFTPKRKMHVYAPGAANYISIDWKIADSGAIATAPVVYPASRMLNLPAIQETVPVYDKPTRLTRDIVIGQENEVAPLIGPDRILKVEGSFQYQACDDRECYLPKVIPLQWSIPVRKLDAQRVSEGAQRKP